MTDNASAPRLLGPPFKGRRLRDQSFRHDYIVPDDLRVAASVALHLQMPLLLTGEPGCGKTDFAWAAATALASAQGEPNPEEAEPLSCYVRSESRARDLLYHYDALSRFGDGQHGEPSRARDIYQYLSLEALGQALLSSRRRVVLIDEIDKAPRDLPNDLLRELDQGHFDIPEIPPDRPPGTALGLPDLEKAQLQRRMTRDPRRPMPLVLITSNQERQLPDPFLRRCVFFHIPFPKRPDMEKILAAYFADSGPAQPGGGQVGPPESLIAPALAVFYRLRDEYALVKPPTTSELLTWVRALAFLLGDGAQEVLPRLQRAVEQRKADVGWSLVPALGCLIKLREDRDTLQVAR